MENVASILLRASQHPEKLMKALLYNGECFAPEDYNWQDICLCTQFWIVINAPECLSLWFLRVPEYAANSSFSSQGLLKVVCKSTCNPASLIIPVLRISSFVTILAAFTLYSPTGRTLPFSFVIHSHGIKTTCICEILAVLLILHDQPCSTYFCCSDP